MTTSSLQQQWQPETILLGNTALSQNYCVMILNRELVLNPDVFIKLWNNAFIRYTVDGGTNRYLDFSRNHCKLREQLKCPDMASGDFDSITPETLKYITELQTVEIIKTPCQDETDFTKALKMIHPLSIKHNINAVIAIVQSSGRMDHIMGNINTLYKSINIIPNTTVYLMSSNSLTWLLRPGAHRIEIPQFIIDTKRWCSLVPMGQPAVVTTTGLKWNLNNTRLEFGGIISTSNTYSDRIVTIETDNYILWSMGTFII